MERFNKARVLIGTMLINCTTCLSLFFGNPSTYMYSVFLRRPRTSSSDMDPDWLYAIYLASYAIGVLTIDPVRKKCGLRFTTGLGIAVYCSSFFLTYFTVSFSVWATALSFSLLAGLGSGILEVSSIYYTAGWFKDNVGLASGMVSASNSLGGMSINPFITRYINPLSYDPDSSNGQITYFSQPDVCDRVPMAFILIGSFFAAVDLAGFFLVKTPPATTAVAESIDVAIENNGEKRYEANKLVLQSNAVKTGTAYTDEAALHPNQCIPDLPESSKESSSSTDENKADENSHQPIGPELDSKTPVQVLKSESFYSVTFSVVAMTLCLMVVINYYKLFGQTLIHDDGFMAATSSVASLFMIVFRLGCGRLVDKAGAKNALIAHLSCCSFLLSLWYFTAMIDRWVYLLWTCLLLCLANDHFLLFPLVVLRLFGQSFYATNLGMLRTASLVVFFSAPPLLKCVLASLGWFWLFFTVAAVCFIVEILVVVRM